jgi:hypothetical protein
MSPYKLIRIERRERERERRRHRTIMPFTRKRLIQY